MELDIAQRQVLRKLRHRLSSHHSHFFILFQTSSVSRQAGLLMLMNSGWDEQFLPGISTIDRDVLIA